MLNSKLHEAAVAPVRQQQRGIVLLLAIIVLVAMSLATIGLMRSVLTSNRVAGNLAFQQSATQSSDMGVERAVAWLEQKSREQTIDPAKPTAPPTPANKLFGNITAGGAEPYSYRASRADPDPVTQQTWEAFWNATLVANNLVNTLPVDAAGNTVSFVIHRLCAFAGDPLASNCESSATLSSSTQTSSKSSGIKLLVPSQTYYRITVRVQGPRNAVSFVQAVVAI
ncbi:hypothetical protein LNV08_10965 [Paucibacter sp. TC2R-5]|uniref:pilus assembly PilX family protein n=1 Tax=Paucibacter sp. TC2R-5 TaxID=2893555 RepID=UPI0021E3EE24|nr:hypothetical protein [Paucibacter sp. TC2R-5]MCV2359496.1 hypothetical protein [Paucibacter sp. TC2R-5]